MLRARRWFNLAMIAVLLAGIAPLSLAGTSGKAAAASAAAAGDLYVSPSGSDANPGTEERPLATLAKARDIVRTMNADMTRDITVYLRGGTYDVREPVVFDERDSGTNGHRIHYRAYPGETPVLSGGVRVGSNWNAVDGKPYLQVSVSEVTETRQLFVNGERRKRARLELPISGKGWVNDPGTTEAKDGFLIAGAQLGTLAKPQHAEVHQQGSWRDYTLAVKGQTVLADGDSKLIFDQPSFEDAMNNSPLTWTPSFTRSFFVENDLSLLDQPGEWYFDKDTKTLYYYPLPGENPAAADIVMPVVNTLVHVEGSDFDNRVRNITFQGLTFAHTTWTQVNAQGMFGNQAEWIFKPDGPADSPWSEHPPGAVQINAADAIDVLDSTFTHLGAAGLEIVYADHSTVEGNYFYDIAEAAVIIGTQAGAVIDRAWEATPAFNTVRNNVVRYTGQEYYGAPAITAYFSQDTLITHNDIAEVPYCGINVNSWTPDDSRNPTRRNVISFNKVENAMKITRDCGSIYTWATLGDADPANYTKIHDNYVISRYQDYGALYLDETSKYAQVYHNVVRNYPSDYMTMYDPFKKNWLYLWRDTIKHLQVTDNYSNDLTWVNNATESVVEQAALYDPAQPGAEVQAIIDAAGLEPAYRHLLDRVPSAGANQAPSLTLEDQSAASVMSSIQLTAGVADDGFPRGGQIRLLWSKISGPGTVTFENPQAAGTTASFSAPGSYRLRFTAHDGELQASREIVVDVTEEANPYTNYAIGKPAKASAFWNGDGLAAYSPEKANDGDIMTGWAGNYRDGAVEEWWQVDLGTEIRIKRIEFVARQEACCSSWLDQHTNLSFIASNDPNFNDYTKVSFLGVLGDTGIEEKGTAVFNVEDDGSYRYIRVLKSPFGLSFMAELRVFGLKATTPDDASLDNLVISEGELAPAFAKGVTAYTVNLPSGKEAISVTPYLSNSEATVEVNGEPAADGMPFGPVALETGVNDIDVTVTSANGLVKTTYAVDVTRSSNAAPVVSAGADDEVSLLDNAALQGTVEDSTIPEGKAISYHWSQVSGPGTATFGDYAAASTTAAFSQAGRYVLKLTGSDGEFSASDTVEITVTDAELPPNLALNKPAVASSYLDSGIGSTSYAPSKAVDGNLDTVWIGDWHARPHTITVDLGQPYSLSRIELVTSRRSYDSGEGLRHNFRVLASNDPSFAEGSYVVLGSQGEEELPYMATWVANVDPGAYRYVRAVKEDTGNEWAFILAEINVYGSPTSDAKTITSFEVPGQLGTSTIDTANHTITFVVPAGTDVTALTPTIGIPANASIDPPSGAAVDFSRPVVYTVTAADGSKLEWTVTAVVEAENDAPVVDAGNGSSIVLTENAALHGSVSDATIPTGSALTSLWSKASGPGDVTFGDERAPATTAAFSAPGVYVLKLAATDGKLSAEDTVTITVGDAELSANLALGKPAAASDYLNADPQYKPEKAVDGDIHSHWIGYWTAYPHWVSVDLQGSYRIGRVEVVMSQWHNEEGYDKFRSGFEVQASNDPAFGTYTVLGRQGDTPLPIKATWTANVDTGPFRYVRVVKPDEWGFIVAEIRVFEGQSLSGEKELLEFRVPGQAGESAIDPAAHTVTFHVPYGTDVTALQPTVAVSDKASVTPASGTAADFTSPVTYLVTAEDGSTQAWVVTAIIDPDAAPPSAPSDVRAAAVEKRSIELVWSASVDNGEVVRYVVYVNGEEKAAVQASQTRATFADLDKDTEYTFTVKAVDAAGNESEPSAPVTVRTKHDSRKK